MRTVQPIEPTPSSTVVVIVATDPSDFDNPPANTIIVAPDYTPVD